MESEFELFDTTTFETFWETLSEQKKADLIAASGSYTPDIAIMPVLKGLLSYHFSIRNNARKMLKKIQAKIAEQIDNAPDLKSRDDGFCVSDKVCFKLYSQLDGTLNLNEQTFYLKTLLNTKGKGADYAFKAVYLGRIALSSAKKILLTLPEIQRMAFIAKFLQARPSIRFRFGVFVRQLLKTISDRNTIVQYYARLFDRNRMADPVLLSLADYLTDPEQLALRELHSPRPELRMVGLKAYSMMVSKIPDTILLEFITSEKKAQVRSVLYRIIENSTFGFYPNAFYPLLEQIGDLAESEQIPVARAMLVTGKMPICSVMDILRDNFPKVLDALMLEISNLSRISFMVIQDLALNRSYYEKHHPDLNLACIYGLVKKRPERVVKLLKQFDNMKDDRIRVSVTRFIEKVKKCLADEKKSISKPFDTLVQHLQINRQNKKSFINRLFTSDTQKKIKLLLNNQETAFIDFKGAFITDVNMREISFRAGALYFSNCKISNCDLSFSRFLNTYWKNTIFFNINMENAFFHLADFTGAIFINVNAGSAVFKNCNFEKAQFYNCSFKQANLKETSFVESVISKTSFNQADLSGASLSFSRLSAVSFAHSIIEQTDFSNVKSRFSRFPNNFKANNPFIDINFNYRKYQLAISDMPQMDISIVSTINMALFSEFIHYGEHQFSKQNQINLLTAYDIFSTRQAHLFHILPYLLHMNIAFPGMKTSVDPDTPCGIFDYVPDHETILILQEYLQVKSIDFQKPANPAIEGLFTIGSTGSLAQTTESDIDFWVCIDERNFDKGQLKLFQEKLTILENFSIQHFSIQVTFFIVDIVKAQNNDFGDSTIESSGSAQARLLKEEFYRTMIHVAGKLPLWAVLPTPISINYYSSIKKNVIRLSFGDRYIDLGDIHAISTSEYFGASIWQMFKWLKSPFKSVIKMALLEKYIFEYGKSPLLCNLYKDKWMNAGLNANLSENDSYYILLDGLVDYYQKQNSPLSVRILLTCFFLKLGISENEQIENTLFGFRKILLEKCLKHWNWNKETVFEIGNFKSWPYKEIAQLSATIENYMITKYKTVNRTFEKMLHTGSQISPEDKTVLGRKILIEFSSQPDKVNKVLLVSRSDRHFDGLHLKYIGHPVKAGTWELINKNVRIIQDQEESLIQARTIEEIAAWLIHNDLYNDLTIINLIPNPTYVTHDDIRKLFSSMNRFLQPLLKQNISFDHLLEKNTIDHMFISINFYAPRKQATVSEYTAVYLNSWGEMFCKSAYFKNKGLSLEQMKDDLLTRVGIQKFPLNTAFYFSKGAVRQA